MRKLPCDRLHRCGKMPACQQQQSAPSEKQTNIAQESPLGWKKDDANRITFPKLALRIELVSSHRIDGNGNFNCGADDNISVSKWNLIFFSFFFALLFSQRWSGTICLHFTTRLFSANASFACKTTTPFGLLPIRAHVRLSCRFHGKAISVAKGMLVDGRGGGLMWCAWRISQETMGAVWAFYWLEFRTVLRLLLLILLWNCWKRKKRANEFCASTNYRPLQSSFQS